MSADSTRNPLNERAPSTQVALNRPSSTPVDPELLRWRVEMLMDEMMLGGVDVGASPSGLMSHKELSSSARAPTQSEVYQNGEPSPSTRTWHEASQNGTYASSTFSSTPAAPEPEQSNRQYEGRPSSDRVERSSMASPVTDPTNHGASPEPQKWLFAAEDRYQQAARTEQTANPPPAHRDSAAQPPGQVWMGEETSNPPHSNGIGHNESPTATTDTVRRVSNQFAGVLSSTTIGIKRSNLLPRMSHADVDTLQREIYTLQHEIDMILPAGHESNKHVRHLLDKAQTILQNDGMRSAEVEYYLQQVRTIFQRVQQTINWSGLYRNRLTVYLSAWLMLALLVILGRYLYQSSLENFIQSSARLATGSLVLQHLSTVLSSFFAGALGGALGALVNLHSQSSMPHGFVDRKFGLRGLILPLMGAIVGLLLYLPLGLLYFLFGLDPAQNLLFSSVPVLLAFLFGISQESLYGTRE